MKFIPVSRFFYLKTVFSVIKVPDLETIGLANRRHNRQSQPGRAFFFRFSLPETFEKMGFVQHSFVSGIENGDAAGGDFYVQFSLIFPVVYEGVF